METAEVTQCSVSTMDAAQEARCKEMLAEILTLAKKMTADLEATNAAWRAAFPPSIPGEVGMPSSTTPATPPSTTQDVAPAVVPQDLFADYKDHQQQEDQERQDVFPAVHLTDFDNHERKVDSKLTLVSSASLMSSPTSTPSQEVPLATRITPTEHPLETSTRCSTPGLYQDVSAQQSSLDLCSDVRLLEIGNTDAELLLDSCRGFHVTKRDLFYTDVRHDTPIDSIKFLSAMHTMCSMQGQGSDKVTTLSLCALSMTDVAIKGTLHHEEDASESLRIPLPLEPVKLLSFSTWRKSVFGVFKDWREQPWPPPMLVEGCQVEDSIIKIRPTPWPSFSYQVEVESKEQRTAVCYVSFDVGLCCSKENMAWYYHNQFVPELILLMGPMVPDGDFDLHRLLQVALTLRLSIVRHGVVQWDRIKALWREGTGATAGLSQQALLMLFDEHPEDSYCQVSATLLLSFITVKLSFVKFLSWFVAWVLTDHEQNRGDASDRKSVQVQQQQKFSYGPSTSYLEGRQVIAWTGGDLCATGMYEYINMETVSCCGCYSTDTNSIIVEFVACDILQTANMLHSHLLDRFRAFGSPPNTSNVRPQQATKLSKPLWFQFIDLVRSWSEKTLLTDGFLLESSPWHTLNPGISPSNSSHKLKTCLSELCMKEQKQTELPFSEHMVTREIIVLDHCLDYLPILYATSRKALVGNKKPWQSALCATVQSFLWQRDPSGFEALHYYNLIGLWANEIRMMNNTCTSLLMDLNGNIPWENGQWCRLLCSSQRVKERQTVLQLFACWGISCSMLQVPWDPGIFEVVQVSNISTHGLGASRVSRGEVCQGPHDLDRLVGWNTAPISLAQPGSQGTLAVQYKRVITSQRAGVEDQDHEPGGGEQSSSRGEHLLEASFG